MVKIRPLFEIDIFSPRINLEVLMEYSQEELGKRVCHEFFGYFVMDDDPRWQQKKRGKNPFYNVIYDVYCHYYWRTRKKVYNQLISIGYLDDWKKDNMRDKAHYIAETVICGQINLHKILKKSIAEQNRLKEKEEERSLKIKK